MADKKPASDKQVGQLAENMADRVKESANQIWLAGLGAYSKAEEEGNKLFDTLVQDGERLEARTRKIVDKPLTAAREKVETVRARATGSWERVEKAFDIRVSKALGRLNIPSRADVEMLNSRIAELEQKLAQLEAAAQSGAVRRRPAQEDNGAGKSPAPGKSATADRRTRKSSH
ncbi:MAG: phasin family protein [Pseudomonadota bacterium]|nr:poly(hydroxyalkanoate) granule-associated protein [Pseudomonadales bacterium]MDY6918813.1 phasin family protein [Pseudomonadota bacterium]